MVSRARQLLLISKDETDIDFWSALAQSNGIGFHHEILAENVANYLGSQGGDRETVVIWDASGDAPSRLAIESFLRARAQPERVLAITDKSFGQGSAFEMPLVFSSHVMRRYSSYTPVIYSTLLKGLFEPATISFHGFFIGNHKKCSWTITASGQKSTTLNKIERFLLSQNVNPKVATLIGREVADELIMNAIFDAPVNDEGRLYRLKTSRSSKFDLLPREQVEVRVACSPNLVGISVIDRFGSCERDRIGKCLNQDLSSTEYSPPPSSQGAGLGLYRINRQRLALMISVQPQKQTEVMVFASNALRYSEIFTGSCFCSILNI